MGAFMTKNRVLAAVAAVMVVVPCLNAQGRGRGNVPAENAAPPAPRSGPPPEEKTSVSKHSARIGGQTVNYTATAGTYVVRDDNGVAKASFFYVGYVNQQ